MSLSVFARALLVLLVALAVVSPLAAAQPSAGGPDEPGELGVEAWRADLDQLAHRIETEHFQPYRRISEADFRAAVAELRAAIPRLTDREVMFRMAELVARIGDGHTRLALPRLDPELAMPLEAGHGGTPPPRVAGLRLANLPVAFGLFDDGLYVVRATRKLARLVGARVESFESASGPVSAAEAVKRTRRLAFADNEQGMKWYAPDRLALPAVLAFLGITDDPEETPLDLVLPDGRRERVVLAPADPAAEWTPLGGRSQEPLWIGRRDEARWSRVLADRHALYVQVNELELHSGEPAGDWYRRVLREGEAAGARRLVIDLRWNFGGSGSWNRAITRAVAASPFNEYGQLFVLTGRRTFSAAQALVQELEVGTLAIFVGEPTGSRPGHFGDPKKGQLEHSGLTLRVSRLYWSPEFAGDTRDAIAPHLPVALTGVDFFAGRDPVLEAALAYRAPEGIGAQVEDLLRRGRIQQAVIHLARFLDDPRFDHQVAEPLAAAGGRLLDDGRLTEASYLFALAGEYFPDAPAVQAGRKRLQELEDHPRGGA